MIEFKPLYCERRKQWIGCKIIYDMHVPTQTVRIVVIEFGAHTEKQWAQDECNMFEKGLKV